MIGDRRIPHASEIVDIGYYRDVASGRRRPDDLAYFSDTSDPVPTTRADVYEAGVTQGYFCQMTAFGLLPTPTIGTPEILIPFFIEGVLTGAEEARRQAEIDADENNVVVFRRR